MARYGSGDVGFFLADGMDLLMGTVTEIEIGKEAIIEETTGLSDIDERHAAVGVKRGMLTQKGFYDDVANSVNTALVGLLQRIVTLGLEGNTLGKRFLGWAGAIAAKYRRIAARGTLHKAEGDWQVTGVVEEGVILHTHSAETTDPGTGSSHDNAASSANGGAGYLQVSALTLGGFTNVLIKIRHSTDNVVFTDLITFTAVTAAPAAQRSTMLGTINRYTRVEWDFTGAGAGQSVKFMAGLVRNP